MLLLVANYGFYHNYFLMLHHSSKLNKIIMRHKLRTLKIPFLLHSVAVSDDSNPSALLQWALLAASAGEHSD